MGDPCCDDQGSCSIDGERLDELLEVVADECRRHALYCLRDARRAELDDLATRVASRLHDRPPDELPEDVVENIRVELHHSHLPILTESGVVEYDSRSNAVVYREPPEAIETLLEFCAEHELED